jgi:solute carrier family 13 (sodium-dependent dicarboxylate transporter), member 2/3/5
VSSLPQPAAIAHADLRRPALATWLPSKALLGFVGSWGLYGLILFAMPLPEGMTASAKATLAVVGWACVTWVTEAVPIPVTGLQIPILILLSGAAPDLTAAASGYTSEAAFIGLASFVMAAVIQSVGLDRRITLTLLHKMRVSTVRGVIWALFAVDTIMSFIVPGANTRGALLLPIVNNINRLFGDTGPERNIKKAIVIHTLVYGPMVCGLVVLTAGLQNLILVDLFKSQLGVEISYLDWLILRWPYLGLALITQWWIRLHFRCNATKIPGGAEAIGRDYASLPRTSRIEWRTLTVFGLTALAWATAGVHHLSVATIAVLGISLLFLPDFLDLDWQRINSRTIWGTYLTLCGAVSLSVAMAKSGLGTWLANLIYPIAEGQAWWAVFIILCVGTHVIRLGLLSNVAATALFAPILLALSSRLGLHPIAFTMLVSDTNTFAYILPTQITCGIIAYGSGTFSVGDYARVGLPTVVIALAYGLLVMIPWYALMGIPMWAPAAPWPF